MIETYKLYKEQGYCAKQVTVAIVVNGDKIFVGQNSCATPVAVCPRLHLPSGQGYEHCKTTCGQEFHAEEMALKKAGEHAQGATMFLIGHTYMCDNCRDMTKEYGIKDVFILGDVICKEKK